MIATNTAYEDALLSSLPRHGLRHILVILDQEVIVTVITQVGDTDWQGESFVHSKYAVSVVPKL